MNKLRLLLVLFLGIFLLFGCKTWEEPDFNIPDWEPPTGTQTSQFWTIDSRFVLGKHENGTPPDSLVPGFYGERLRYIRAVVVSSDEGGNYYKSMVIQDPTGGVELQLDMSGLYNTYPVGQKIVLVCNGLVIGDYRSLPQIGWIYQETQVGRINSLFFDKYIIKDGMPSLKNLPKALKNDEIDFSGFNDINKLVCLENVTFEDAAVGKPLSFNDFTTEWIINVPVKGEIQPVTVRTSNYAKFRSTIIQKREYNLSGILTVYQSGSRITYQLMIRTKDDIVFFSEQPDEIIEFDFTKNPIENGGWSVKSLLGNTPSWIYRPSSQLMLHPGNQSGDYQTAMDDWFISPVITFSDMENGFLRFEHQLNLINGHDAPYQIYYTTSTAEPFNINNWKSLEKITNFPVNLGWSNHLSLKNISSNSFRIAFRYNAPNPEVETYDWSIRKVEIRNK